MVPESLFERAEGLFPRISLSQRSELSILLLLDEADMLTAVRKI